MKRERLWSIIFLSDTRAGRIFDVILLCLIGLSVFTIMLESVDEWRADYGRVFMTVEWVFTIPVSYTHLTLPTICSV